MSELAPAPELALSGERQQQMRLAIAALAALGVLGWIGVLGFGYLVNDWPLVLIALAPLNRHLILVAPNVELWAFLSVGVVRALLSCLAAFALGRAVGSQALVWLERNSPRMSRFVRWVERLFERSSHVALLVWPNVITSMLAGIAGMRVLTLVALAGLGLIARLLIVAQLGSWLLEPIEWVLDQIAQHRIAITIAIVLAFAVYQWRQRTRGDSGAATSADSPAGSTPPSP